MNTAHEQQFIMDEMYHMQSYLIITIQNSFIIVVLRKLNREEFKTKAIEYHGLYTDRFEPDYKHAYSSQKNMANHRLPFEHINTMRPTQCIGHFKNGIFSCIFINCFRV